MYSLQNVYVKTSSNFTSRSVTINGNTLTFTTGYANTESSSNTTYCVPLKIWGIKTSYVTPTEVIGMQYVEVE